MKGFYLFTVLATCLLSPVKSAAQLDTLSVTHQKINFKIVELKKNKIDTILCYYTYCIGRMPKLVIKDSCLAYDTEYLVWCDRGKFFMERFDECKSYPIQLFYQNPFYKPLKSYDKLRTEKILPREYRARVGNKIQLIVEDIDHTCSAMFDFYLGKKSLHKEIDLSYLDRLLDEDKHLNKNYAHNRSTIIASVREEMEQMVYLYNNKNRTK